MREVKTHKDLPDVLPRALYRGVSLKADGSGFYYALQSRETGIRIRYHGLGTSTSRDPEVFGGGYEPSAWVGARVSENGRHVVFEVQYGWARNEVFVQDLAAAGAIEPVVTGFDAHFQADFAGDRLIVLTDWQAPNGRIVEVDPGDPAPAHWREIVPSAADVHDTRLVESDDVRVRVIAQKPSTTLRVCSTCGGCAKQWPTSSGWL